MSFVSLSQKELHRALAVCNQISPKKSDIDIFTYTKVSIENEKFKLTAINHNLFFTHELNLGPAGADLGSKVEFLIKTDLFFNAVALITDEMVGLDINLDRTTLLVQGAKSKHTLRLNVDGVSDFIVPSEDFAQLNYKLKVKTTDFSDALRVAVTTVGQPKYVYQPEFLSICLTLKPTQSALVMAASDRFRISRTRMEAQYLQSPEQIEEEGYINYLLNPKSLQLLVSGASSEEFLELNIESDYLWAKFGQSTLTLRYGEGKFPDYEKIIPQSFTCNLLINTKDLAEALKQTYFSARANVSNKSITLTINPAQKSLTLEAKTDEGYASESTVNLESYEGIEEVWNQSFNAEYLMDYVSNVNTTNILWEANPGKPLVMSPENEKDRQICLVSGLK